MRPITSGSLLKWPLNQALPDESSAMLWGYMPSGQVLHLPVAGAYLAINRALLVTAAGSPGPARANPNDSWSAKACMMLRVLVVVPDQGGLRRTPGILAQFPGPRRSLKPRSADDRLDRTSTGVILHV